MTNANSQAIDPAPQIKTASLEESKRSKLRRFVEDLFTHLLGRDRFTNEEVSYWTEYLISGDDPIDVFCLFLSSAEYRSRLENRQNTQTAYPPGHFYSPVVDTAQVSADQDRIFANRSPLGIDLRPDIQERMFRALAEFFPSLPFSDDPDGRHRYHYGNSSFGFGDACIYWSMLGLLRPGRLIEIGGGFTSALALDAIDHFDLETRCTFIDPYPGLLLSVTEPRSSRHDVIAQPVQSVGAALASTLETNDLLFIDSSHVLKTGSDVTYELTEMLPRLSSGVIVHFHDVFYPFEYPKDWVIDDNKSWNELYAIETFLMFNQAFEIIFFNDFFLKMRRDVVVQSARDVSARLLLNPGGGLWLRRK